MRALIGVVAGAMTMATGGVAEAHTFGLEGASLVHGLMHPIVGVDHVLAMIAVGLWAAQLGGRALWSMPLAFVGMMTLGGLAAMGGLQLPGIESGVVGSLLIVGALVAGAVRLPAEAGAAIVGFLALFHGYAHGAEMPVAASAALYASGFALGTVLLHGIGVLVGLSLRHSVARWLVRAGGAGVAAAGLVLLIV